MSKAHFLTTILKKNKEKIQGIFSLFFFRMAYLAKIPVYTTKLFNTDKHISPLGLVVGYNMQSVSVGRAWLDDMASFLGGSSGLMRKKMDDLFKKAMRDLQKNTAIEFPKATAIYNAEFFFNTTEGGNPGLAKLGSSMVQNIFKKGLIVNAAEFASNAETQVTEHDQSRGFELSIVGTAVIERKSKTRRSSRRKSSQ
jgi:uncharacterized protein YbjQ (UPF0145 family)